MRDWAQMTVEDFTDSPSYTQDALMPKPDKCGTADLLTALDDEEDN